MVTINIRNSAMPRHARRICRELRDGGAFFLEFIRHPATVGSVYPSSNALAGRMLAHAAGSGGIMRGEPGQGGLTVNELAKTTLKQGGLVIDLGAGSGAVSAGLVHAGVTREQILAVEALGEFAEPFAARCPGIRLVIADARNLRAVLDREAPGETLCAVISSLPFRALGPQMTRDILREVTAALRERGGVFVQYSYAWWLRYPLRHHGLTPGSASVVWKNLPPARVESYEVAALPCVAATEQNRTVAGKILRRAAATVETVGGAVLRTALGAVAGAMQGFSAIKYCWQGFHGKP